MVRLNFRHFVVGIGRDLRMKITGLFEPRNIKGMCPKLVENCSFSESTLTRTDKPEVSLLFCAR